MKKALLVTCITLTVPAIAQADTIGFRIGGDSWQQDYEGEVRSSAAAIDEVNIVDDLGLDDETGTHFYVVIEHPVPAIPNIKLERTELDTEETSTLTRGFTFDGETYNISDQVTTTSDLSHTDATLYYELLDNWISLDLGLTIRQFDEGIELSTTGTNAELDLDVTVPMLYAAAKIELPLSGLYLNLEGKGIGYSDASLIDYSASLGYETSFGLGIQVGYRSFDIEYDDDDEEANLTIDGAYAGLFYHF